MTLPDPAAFLHTTLPRQPEPVTGYRVDDRQWWLKKAGAMRPQWPYRLLGLLARLLRMPALAPVPNPGGPAAVATEVRRLRALAAAGLRVPPVLAVETDGFLMDHLGQPGRPTPSLAEEMNENTATDPQKVLLLFRQGLDAVGVVHAAGTCLSQGFARNLVLCPDGVVGYVDFEDDPAAALPMALCRLRDVLCYVHSAAVYLYEAGMLDAARPHWQTWLAGQSAEVQVLVAESASRMRWLRRLPQDRRWGRDLQRARAAWSLVGAA
jgi:hypothetical protein